MKIIWKLVIILVVAGIFLMMIGYLLGASTTLYLDRTGIHVPKEIEYRIKDLDIGYINEIYIDINHCDVEFIKADKYGIDACSYDTEWEWSHENDTLIIDHSNRYSMHILSLNLSNQSPKRNYIKVYLPNEAKLNSVQITSNSGSMTIGDLDAELLKIYSSYGNVKLNSVSCISMSIDLDSSDFTGKDLVAESISYTNKYGDSRFSNVNADTFTADCNSGDLTLDTCTYNDMSIKNSYGKVNSNDLTCNKADISAYSGDVTISGNLYGETQINANYSDINITTSGMAEDYSYDLTTKYGKIVFDGEALKDSLSLKGGTVSDRVIKIIASSGDILVYFSGE